MEILEADSCARRLRPAIFISFFVYGPNYTALLTASFSSLVGCGLYLLWANPRDSRAVDVSREGKLARLSLHFRHTMLLHIHLAFPYMQTAAGCRTSLPLDKQRTSFHWSAPVCELGRTSFGTSEEDRVCRMHERRTQGGTVYRSP